MLEVRLLGHLELRYEGRPWAFGVPPRATSLLAYLAVHAGESISRATLATLLWPDDPEDEARGKLRRHLHRIAKALPPLPSPWISVTASTVRCELSTSVRVDLHEFSVAADDPARVAEAIDLYRGELLEGSYDDWLLMERERQQSRFLELCYDAAMAARSDRDFEAATRYAERMLAVDEWREDALRMAMASRYEAGDRATALAAFEKFAGRLRAEMGVEPMPETLALRSAMLANAPIAAATRDAVADGTPGGSRMPFVGRDDEVRAINAAWMRAARGNGSTILISGEAGIGKSRLVGEIAQSVAAQGGRTLFGGTSNPQAFPYEPVVDALRRNLSLVAESPIERVWLASLAELIPELHAMHPDLPENPPLEGARARARLFEAIARTIEQLSRARPLLFVVEDAHWAQTATIDALEAIARRIGALPVLMLVTYRTEEAGANHSINAMRRRLQSERRASAIALGGLNEAETRELVAKQGYFEDVTEKLAVSVYALSEGNPLFAGQLLGGYAETGVLPSETVANSNVTTTILSRVDALAPAARTLAEAAATIGRSFTIETAARALGWQESDVFDALGMLIDRSLVREAAEGGSFSYAFTHALIAAAIYDAMPSERRVMRHRRIAQVLEQYGHEDRQTLAAIARHWHLGLVPALAAKAYAEAADAALAIYARDEAAAYAREALHLTDDVAARFRMLHVASRAQVGAADRQQWREDLEALTNYAEMLGDEERYDALEQWVEYYAQIAARPQQRATIDRMLELAGQEHSGRQAIALCSLGMLELLQGNLKGAGEILRRSFEIARKAGDRATAALARNRLVQVLLRLGSLEEARAEIAAMRDDGDAAESFEGRRHMLYAQCALAIAMEDGKSLASAGADLLEFALEAGDVEDEARGHGLIAIGAKERFDPVACRREYSTAIDLCERLGQLQLQAVTLVNWGESEAFFGDVERAVELYERADALIEQSGSRIAGGYSALFKLKAAVLRGELDAAIEHGLRAKELGEATGEYRLTIGANVGLGFAYCERGETQRGLELLELGVKHRREAKALVPLVDDLCLYALALLRAGEKERALEVAAELREYFERDLEHRENPARLCWTLVAVARANGDEKLEERAIEGGRAYLRPRLEKLDGAERQAFESLPYVRDLLERINA